MLSIHFGENKIIKSMLINIYFAGYSIKKDDAVRNLAANLTLN